jgi:ABC-type glycerol-3-phosphate transport system substrate-binding protein
MKMKALIVFLVLGLLVSACGGGTASPTEAVTSGETAAPAEATTGG